MKPAEATFNSASRFASQFSSTYLLLDGQGTPTDNQGTLPLLNAYGYTVSWVETSNGLAYQFPGGGLVEGLAPSPILSALPLVLAVSFSVPPTRKDGFPFLVCDLYASWSYVGFYFDGTLVRCAIQSGGVFSFASSPAIPDSVLVHAVMIVRAPDDFAVFVSSDGGIKHAATDPTPALTAYLNRMVMGATHFVGDDRGYYFVGDIYFAAVGQPATLLPDSDWTDFVNNPWQLYSAPAPVQVARPPLIMVPN